MFKFLYEKVHSLWRWEHLKIIIDEVIYKGDAQLLTFLLNSQRTHVLFDYHTYFDRLHLTGHILTLSKSYLPTFDPSTILLARPYQTPFIFHMLSNITRYSDETFFKPLDFFTSLTDDDIAEYIEGVESNQAFYMVSEVYRYEMDRGDKGMPKIAGLEELIGRVEGHYMYF
jgi:hypothetical protein